MPKLAARSKPRSPARQAEHIPCSSSGYAFTKGVLQEMQKYSASRGAGDCRQSSHTGTRVHLRSGRSQMRQSSGKKTEKMPWGITVMASRRRLDKAVLAMGRREKVHVLTLCRP